MVQITRWGRDHFLEVGGWSRSDKSGVGGVSLFGDFERVILRGPKSHFLDTFCHEKRGASPGFSPFREFVIFTKKCRTLLLYPYFWRP